MVRLPEAVEFWRYLGVLGCDVSAALSMQRLQSAQTSSHIAIQCGSNAKAFMHSVIPCLTGTMVLRIVLHSRLTTSTP